MAKTPDAFDLVREAGGRCGARTGHATEVADRLQRLAASEPTEVQVEVEVSSAAL